MDIDQMKSNADIAAALLKNLANPSRLMVLCALISREHSAGELEELAGLSQSALSQHLSRLRSVGLVSTRRDGQKIFYALADDKAKAIVEVLHRLYCI